MRTGLSAAAALAVAAAAACTHGAPDEARIVFQSNRSGLWGMYSVRPDGSDLGKVVAYPASDYAAGFAYWSPGGKRLFVPVERERGGHALVIDARTGTRKRLGVHDIGGASWSPDGNRIAVAAERGIIVVDADGSNRRQLTYDPYDSDPAWSPDGQRIAFVAGGNIYTIAAGGGTLTRTHVLNVGDEDVYGPTWSHDSEVIAFGRSESATGTAPLEVVRPDGSGRRRLAADAEQARWSPSERTLLYVRAGDIFRVDADGRKRSRLTFDGPSWTLDRSVSWAPDGDRIAYVAGRLAKGIRDARMPADVWVMNADGSGRRPVTRAFPPGGTNVYAEWVEREPKVRPVGSPKRLVSLPEHHVLHSRQPIGGLGVQGSTAVVVQGLGSGPEFDNPPGPLLVWNPASREIDRVPVGECGTAGEPMLVGQRVVYVCNNSAIDLIALEIRVAPLRGRTAKVVDLRATHLVGASFRSRLFQGVAAGRGTVVYGVGEVAKATVPGFRVLRTTVWRVAGTRPSLITSLDGEATVADADATRIAVLQRGAVLVIDARTGSIRRRIDLQETDVRDVELERSRLGVLSRERLSLYDVASGRRRVSRRVPRDGGVSRQLAGIDGDLAVYVAGVAIHLVRLSSGRDVVVDLRDAADPVYARLTPAGLFYSYTAPRQVPAGRTVFVPRRSLESALQR